jgi:PEP-CTERM motif
MSVLVATGDIIAILHIADAGAAVARFFANLAVQVPEPGMMLFFGIGAGVLGLRMGRIRKK